MPSSAQNRTESGPRAPSNHPRPPAMPGYDLRVPPPKDSLSSVPEKHKPYYTTLSESMIRVHMLRFRSWRWYIRSQRLLLESRSHAE